MTEHNALARGAPDRDGSVKVCGPPQHGFTYSQQIVDTAIQGAGSMGCGPDCCRVDQDPAPFTTGERSVLDHTEPVGEVVHAEQVHVVMRDLVPDCLVKDPLQALKLNEHERSRTGYCHFVEE